MFNLNKNIHLTILVVTWIFHLNKSFGYDATVLGLAKFNDGLGRISISLMDILKDNLKINFLKTREYFPYEKEINPKVVKIICSSKNNANSNFVILTDSLNFVGKFKYILKNSKLIRIAYSMFETTRIPESWARDLNHYFDAVVVPDNFFIDVYKNSGVKIPIFVLPIGIYLNDCLKKTPKKQANQPFVFGCLSSFDKRKNHEILIESFFKEFGNSKKVVLRINGRAYFNEDILKTLRKYKASNIIITNHEVPWKKYIDFLSSFDCYVSIAKGEGFSIPPREALAMGIPCIISNNTAQTTICNTGFVRAIPSNIPERPIPYENIFGSKNLGFFFNCTVHDLRGALRDVYNNYNHHLAKAHNGRNWVKQYNCPNLKQKYLNLFKPKKVILGKENIITNEYLMTNCKHLYLKYKKILKR